MGLSKFDLFVVNQNVTTDILRKKISKSNNVFLSTHMYLPMEKVELSQLSERVIFHTFDDFLIDKSMSQCDDSAFMRQATDAGNFDFNHYMMDVVHQKNLIVAHAVINKYKPDRIFVSDGLGIDKNVWDVYESLGSYNAKLKFFQEGILSKGMKKISSLLSFKTFFTIRKDKREFLFVSDIKRLKLNGNVSIREKKYLSFLYKAIVLFSAFLGKNISTTIHGFDRFLLKTRTNRTLFVFTDGFFPSNYPASYIRGYGEETVFFAENFINAKWFSRLGLRVYFNDFLEPTKMQKAIKCCHSEKVTVLVAFNHAADWTALINRSDTDKLFDVVVRLSMSVKGVKFVLRLHPTMAHPRHEGVSSFKRLKSYVANLASDNLIVSNNSLEKDLLEADIVMSEYSNVLIHGIASGKLGVIVNVTNRRNFMIDFVDLGFHYCDSLSQLTSFFENVLRDSNKIILQQNQAVERYNIEQKSFIENNSYLG